LLRTIDTANLNRRRWQINDAITDTATIFEATSDICNEENNSNKYKMKEKQVNSRH